MHARLGRNIVWVLVGGFSLTIMLLIGAGFMGMQARDAIERSHASLRERHRHITRVIDEIQSEEAGLNNLFYAIVTSRGDSPGDSPRGSSSPSVTSGGRNDEELLSRLTGIEQKVRLTLAAARASNGPEPWAGVTAAAETFMTEVRRVLEEPGSRIDDREERLYQTHEALATALSTLISDAEKRMVEESQRDERNGKDGIARAGMLLAIGVVSAFLCAIATIGIALHMFRRMEWQARELARLSAHVLDTQEQILQRFSHELHDELGQTLTAIEANLAALPAPTTEAALRKEDSVLLVKDAIGTVRELSQLLRPSTLDDFGLASSLQWLVESFSQRTQIAVEPKLAFEGRLNGDIETHLFRIAQEALTNVARHSGATSATVSLLEDNGCLRLSVTDNGRGLPAGRSAPARSGFGLIGMRERMRAAGGLLRVQSGEHGVTVIAEVPLHAAPSV